MALVGVELKTLVSEPDELVAKVRNHSSVFQAQVQLK